MIKFHFKFIATLILYTLSYNAVVAAGIDFFKGDWDGARQLAQKQHKALFVTAYTDWCSACRQVEADAQVESTLGDYYNAHFVSYKVNVETQEGKLFAEQYGIQALPDCLFLDADGRIIHRSNGKMDKWDLLSMGMKAAAYLPERAGASNKTYSHRNDIFQEQSQKQQKNSWEEKNIWGNVALAIAQRDATIIQQVETTLSNLPDGEEQKEAIWAAYYEGVGDYAAYARLERQRKLREAQWKDPVFWHEKAAALIRQSTEKKYLEQALQWVEFSISLEPKYDNQETYAYILYKLGKHKEAVKAAKTALELAETIQQPCHGAYNLLQMLRN